MGENKSTFVSKKIELLVNIGEFESLRVGSEIGETIEWKDEKDKIKKMEQLSELLKQEVARDVNDVLSSFELKRKSGVKIENRDKRPL